MVEVFFFSGDKVSFFIATDKRNRSMCARKVTLVERSTPTSRFKGRVSGMKDSFGFIKRSDVTGKWLEFIYRLFLSP